VTAIRVELCAADRVDDVRDLWLQLHHHHRRVAPALPLVDEDALSWHRRRALYLDRLERGTGFLALAVDAEVVVGYALVCIENGPDDTFPLSERYAELYSLSVAEHARGNGIGTQLLDVVDSELAALGIHELKVAAMVGNDAARRFYERRGLRAAEVVLYRFRAHASP